MIASLVNFIQEPHSLLLIGGFVVLSFLAWGIALWVRRHTPAAAHVAFKVSLLTRFLVGEGLFVLCWVLNNIELPHPLHLVAVGVHIIFVAVGVYYIYGLLAFGRSVLTHSIINSRTHLSGHHLNNRSEKEIREVIHDFSLNAGVFIVLVGLFLYFVGYAPQVRWVLDLFDRKILDIHAYVIPVIAAALYISVKLRRLFRNTLLHTICVMPSKNPAIDLLKRVFVRHMAHSFLWLSIVFVLGLALLLFEDVRHSTLVALSIRVLLYSYFTYVLMAATSLLPHVLTAFTKLENKLIINAIVKLTKILIFIVGVTFILGACGINTSAFLASLGISGAAIALAGKNSIENIISGMVILFEKPFEIGDSIQIGPHAGVVVDVRFIYTELELGDKTRILIPNGITLGSSIQNNSRAIKKAIALDFYLFWKTPSATIDKVIEDIWAFIKHSGALVETGSSVLPSSFADGRVLLNVSTFSSSTAADAIARARHVLFNHCKQVLEDNGVEFALQQQIQIAHAGASAATKGETGSGKRKE